eukprot:5007066-Pyramimonas_sp.AAC.1
MAFDLAARRRSGGRQVPRLHPQDWVRPSLGRLKQKAPWPTKSPPCPASRGWAPTWSTRATSLSWVSNPSTPSSACGSP